MRGEGFRNTNGRIVLRDEKETARSFALQSSHLHAHGLTRLKSVLRHGPFHLGVH